MIPSLSVTIATPWPTGQRIYATAALYGRGLDKHSDFGLNETKSVIIRKEISMAVWNCEKCGYEKEGRCKPKKCPECNEQTVFVKQDA